MKKLGDPNSVANRLGVGRFLPESTRWLDVLFREPSQNSFCQTLPICFHNHTMANKPEGLFLYPEYPNSR
jgi:hypothetical protein